MKKSLFLMGLFALLISCKGNVSKNIPQTDKPQPVNLILDTDLGLDYDDVGAMALMHALADSGQVNILATLSSNHDERVVPCIEVLNTYFNRPAIPVGAPKSEPGASLTTWHKTKWTDELPANYPHHTAKTSDAPDALKVYRKILSEQPDTSVVICTIGFFSNLRDLLQSGADEYSDLSGKELVAKKVKRLVSMAGLFPEGKEFNVYCDVPASKVVADEWPTEIVFSGFEIGNVILTGKKLVLRVNTGSQMHLENQIEYEYHALELLADSGRTPVPVFVDGSKKELPYGVMVMEFLEGSALDYRKNLMEAAECLADIHSVPVKETDGLISPSNPLQAILDECNQMVQTYYESDLGEEKKKVQIRRLLELGQEKINEIRDYSGYRCCINTELNSGNFLMNGAGKDNYLVDWEKPLYGDPVQDLGHFLAPTTTFWKTDLILTEEEMADFTRKYIQAVNGRFDVSGIEERLNIFIPITCLRGITWCAMAWVEYQEPGRLIRNEETFKKMEDYLNRDFLDMIEERYYK